MFEHGTCRRIVSLILIVIWAIWLKKSKVFILNIDQMSDHKMKYPDVATFDLDYTVWPCYCDSHINPPLKPIRSSNGEVRTVVDASGYEVTIYPDIYKILSDLKQNDVKLISASRTWAPDIAKQMLKTFKMSYNGSIVPLTEIFDVSEWGERSKVGHIRDSFKIIYGDTNLDKRDICLFDDEGRNKEVERYGIKFVYVKDPERGATWKLYQDYLKNK
ncbi:hypothetical protein ZYGR_0I05510 [Zygosaccharomyces rouxii]|uniref:ZYRO0C13068p n=2 Tax=Zygosaccharomyces rouxii TaxID=4956 RepID=C5DU16_ZYGRC|nr:uncharacterized protein ZYRO0C13068g [Zygosaccharomyces rouxii]KAH9201547.1 acid phosphatase-domain-containing protein [Zygosaccharomyces rouxii]GAV48254.1 hypothetical protein ZYGR_0I05510 [Zygosaccharomyces rouxii]CAR27277.1 ZYRO0C13068p [Zygosaccharomyces rouxii]